MSVSGARPGKRNPSPRFTTSPDFFGRKAEVAVLTRAMRESGGGKLRVVLLSGPPGIGKTRLAEQTADAARAAGRAVLSGRWREDADLPEFWVWRHVARQLLRATGRTVAADELDSSVDLLPDGEETRFQLFEAIRRLLSHAGQSRPLLLLLDNIHLAGAASLQLLSDIFDELSDCPATLVLAFRDLPADIHEPFSSFLAETRQLPIVCECRLENLAPAETAALVESVLESRPTARLLDEIQRSTLGNPLFARETARLCRGRLDSLGDPDPVVWRELVPSAVAVAISRRFVRLSDAEQLLLRQASLVGEEFWMEDLALLSDGATRAVMENAVDEAVRHGFLAHGDAPGYYRFSHAIVHQAIESQLTDADRRACCRRIAEGVEGSRASELAVYALRLAWWWAQAAGEDGGAKARGYLMQAARDALGRGAWEEAGVLFSRVADPGSFETPRTEEEAEVCLGIGRARFQGDTPVEAVPLFKRAFDWYRSQGRLDRMMEIATQPGYLIAGEPGAFNFFDSILSDLPPDSPETGMVLHFLSLYRLNCRGDYQGAERALLRALEIGLRHGDLLLQLRCLSVLAYMCVHMGRFDEALRRLEGAECLLRDVSDPYSEIHVQMVRNYYLQRTGRALDATPYLDRAVGLSLCQRNAFFIGAAHRDRARLFLRSGEWVKARAFVDRGLELSPRFVWLLDLRVYLEYMTGDFDAGDYFRKRLIALQKHSPQGPYLVHLKACSTAVARSRHSGDARDLGRHVPFLHSTAVALEAHPDIAYRSKLLLAFIGALMDDPSLAKEGYDSIRAAAPSPLLQGCHTERILGLAAHAFGDHGKAMEHLEEALRLTRSFHDQPLEAWVHFELAEAQIPGPPVAGPPDDALRNIRAALETARALGMGPLREKAENLLSTLAAQGSGLMPPHAHLSAREREVLGLAAEGLSNKEIAVKLRISANTVANHLRRIYEKTGTTNRTEAARVMRRQ